MAICSLILALPRRRTGSSRPITSMVMGSVPVVLQNTRTPPARRPASIKRLTVDFPRVPFTCTTWRRQALAFRFRTASQIKYPIQKADKRMIRFIPASASFRRQDQPPVRTEFNKINYFVLSYKQFP